MKGRRFCFLEGGMDMRNTVVSMCEIAMILAFLWTGCKPYDPNVFYNAPVPDVYTVIAEQGIGSIHFADHCPPETKFYIGAEIKSYRVEKTGLVEGKGKYPIFAGDEIIAFFGAKVEMLPKGPRLTGSWNAFAAEELTEYWTQHPDERIAYIYASDGDFIVTESRQIIPLVEHFVCHIASMDTVDFTTCEMEFDTIRKEMLIEPSEGK